MRKDLHVYVKCSESVYVHECLFKLLQIPSNISIASLDAYAAALVDQFVDYACATNGRGQYCAVAQLMDSATDVCAESQLHYN